jgi:hypothetical protein
MVIGSGATQSGGIMWIVTHHVADYRPTLDYTWSAGGKDSPHLKELKQQPTSPPISQKT